MRLGGGSRSAGRRVEVGFLARTRGRPQQPRQARNSNHLPMWSVWRREFRNVESGGHRPWEVQDAAIWLRTAGTGYSGGGHPVVNPNRIRFARHEALGKNSFSLKHWCLRTLCECNRQSTNIRHGQHILAMKRVRKALVITILSTQQRQADGATQTGSVTAERRCRFGTVCCRFERVAQGRSAFSPGSPERQGSEMRSFKTVVAGRTAHPKAQSESALGVVLVHTHFTAFGVLPP